jgi:hypothetical protein
MDRRQFCRGGLFGLAPFALAHMLAEQSSLAKPVKPNLAQPDYSLTEKPPHHEPKARAMISLFMQGGPSQVDLLDPKPTLTRMDGEDFPGKIKYDDAGGASRKILGSPWKFAQYGESGIPVSELLPQTAGIVDEITVIRSMHTGVNNHGQSIHAMNSGRVQQGRPSLGSWISYALGCETNSLPAFIAMSDPQGLPVEGVLNWSNGWLPSQPPEQISSKLQANYLDFLRQVNQRQLDRYSDNTDLAARIANFELAALMQTSARDALDLSQETKATHQMYGLDDANKDAAEYGARCLIARRLVERGVRFVQLFTKNQYWDHHGSILSRLPASCRKTDRGAAALIKDLKQRGLLDSTVVHWGGEMGRLPVIQNDAGRANIGRDHNTYGFTMWVAGGGFRGGMTYGESDEFGHHAVKDIVNHFDYHATLMHLFGLQAENLVFKRNGREASLVDGQGGRIIEEILR